MYPILVGIARFVRCVSFQGTSLLHTAQRLPRRPKLPRFSGHFYAWDIID